MPQRQKQKFPPQREDDALAYRQAEFARADAKPEDRSLNVTLATETPVRVFDWNEGKIVDEVLVMAGGSVPRQLPLLDSHSRYRVRDIRGSIRDLRVDGEKLVGRAYFAANDDGEQAFELARDGHLSDVSIGFEATKVEKLDSGETRTIAGREYRGPLRLVTRWRAKEGSLVAIGADENAKIAVGVRAYLNPDEAKGQFMNEQFRALCISKGMKADLSDEDALRWAEENLDKRTASDPAKEAATSERQAAPAVDVEKAAKEIATRANEMIENERKAREAHRESLRKMATAAGLTNAEAIAERMFNEGVSATDAGMKILEEQAKQRQSAVGIAITHDHGDKFRAAALDGIALRAFGQNAPESFKPADGAQQIRRTPLLEVARQCLEQQGVSARRLDDREVFRRATLMGEQTRASDGQAYMVTGTFANLLLDAINKKLLNAYVEAESTYQRWIRIAESVPDFKTIYRMRLGELGWQPVVGENDDYKDLAYSDSKESYRVEKRGSMVSLTWEAVKNDDLNAFTRTVSMQSMSMKRTVNQSVYQLLFDNPTLSDTGALFNSTALTSAGGHDNLVASDASVATFNTMFTKFALKKGLNSDVILGLRPKYIICASGILADMWQVMNSVADPAAGGSAVGNSNTRNIYGPGGTRSLEVIEEPLLDGNDADLWFAACSTDMIDTIELTFLQGEETPVFEQETAFVNDAVKYKIRQTWGVGAIDFRGLYKSTGA